MTVICGRGNGGIQVVSKDNILSVELLIKGIRFKTLASFNAKFSPSLTSHDCKVL
jgi:hypothetical protein